MTIGQRIKQKREELHMSQDELAKKLGYKSRSSINKIELDQRNLTQSKIKAIADALNTTPTFIMGWDEKIEQEKSQICDLFHQCYGKEAYQTVSHFLQLDTPDRQTVDILIDSMLKNDKYRQDTVRNA